MHDYNFGHFDIKMENILMLDEYNVVMHDFGNTVH